MEFKERYLYLTSSPSRYRPCLIYTIFDIFDSDAKNNVDRGTYA